MELQLLEIEINKNLQYSKYTNKCQVIESGKDFVIVLYRNLSELAKYEDCIAMPANHYDRILRSIQASNRKRKLNRFLNRK